MNNLTLTNFWKWYDDVGVKFEIIKFLFNREFVLLSPSWTGESKFNTRNLRCHSVQHLDFLLFRLLKVQVKNTIYNLYHSLAKFENGLPMQTANLGLRDNEEWNKNYHKSICKYDYLLDVDAGDFEDIFYAHETAERIMKLFDKLLIPYEIRFSGMGFHFLIDGDYFKDLNLSFNPHNKKTIYNFYSGLSKKLCNKYSELIDFTINDSRRVVKIPYSLAIFEKDFYVCYPFFSKNEFKNFKLEDMKPENVIDRVKMRGKFIFNENKTKSLNISKFNKLLCL